MRPKYKFVKTFVNVIDSNGLKIVPFNI